MPWKLDSRNALIVNDSGDPIWIDESGEKAVDYQAMTSALSRANREAAERKARLREMESRYAAASHIENFDGWHAEAADALEAFKELSESGQSLQDHISARVELETGPLKQQLAQVLESRRLDREALSRRTVEAAFGRSEFVRDRLTSPALAADLFGAYFVIDDEGRPIAQGLEDSGTPGVHLGFDQALAQLVDRYPGRDFILKGGAGSGSGALPGAALERGRISRGLADCRTEDDKLNYLNNVGS